MLISFTTASVQASVKLTTIANDTSFAAGIYVASCPTQRAELGIFARHTFSATLSLTIS